MQSDYSLRKAKVDKNTAIVLFNQDFTTKAFEEGFHLKGGPHLSGSERPRFPPPFLSWLNFGGKQQLAVACYAYLLTFGLRDDRPDSAAFESLVREIQQGAERVAYAADEIANQINRHLKSKGELEPIRYAALQEMSASISGSVVHLDNLTSPKGLRIAGDPIHTHGLSSCKRLAETANSFLERYRAHARSERAAGQRVLQMDPGRPADRDLDDFIADLARVYSDGLKAAGYADKVPNARDSGSAARPSPAPFRRFVVRVFEELADKDLEPATDRIPTRWKAPSSDVLKAAMARA